MKRLYREKSNEMIAGVCSGIAEYLDIDPTVVRLLFVLFALAAGGGVMVYIVLWIIMPERPGSNDAVVEIKEKPAAPKKVAEKKVEPATKPVAKKAPVKKSAAPSAPKKPTATKKTATKKTTTPKAAKKTSEAKTTTKKDAASKPE